LSAFLDTSLVVRYLIGDPPELAKRAAEVIDQEEDLLVNEVVMVETAYVLTSVYKVPREVVVDHLILFLQKKNIHAYAIRKDFMLQALILCRPSGRVSFADAMVWAAAQASDVKTVYSFDERFPGEGIKVLRVRS
jgi:predicted nucleic-acid-binding protein